MKEILWLVQNDGLSQRSLNALLDNGIETFPQLQKAWEQGRIKHFRNLGSKSLNEIESFISSHGSKITEGKISNDELGLEPESKDFLLNETHLSVRSLNALKSRSIISFKDLHDFLISKGSIERLPNVGMKTAYEITNFFNNNNAISKDESINEDSKSIFPSITDLHSLIKCKPLEAIDCEQEIIDILYLKNIREVGDLQGLNEDYLNKILQIDSEKFDEFVKDVNKFCNEFTNLNSIYSVYNFIFFVKPNFKKWQSALESRFFDNATLELCGEMMDVTRERVRQVESSFLKTFLSFVGDNYQKELSKYLKENKNVKNVFELEKVGASFKNISKLILMGTDSRRFLNNLFKKDSQISWERNGIYYNFYESSKESRETLIANVDFKTDLFFDMNFDEYISYYCVIHDREHLKKQIIEEAKTRLLKKPGAIASYCAKRLLSLEPNGFTKEDVAEISKKELNHDIKNLRSAMESLRDSRAPSDLQLLGNSGKFIWVSEYLPMSKEKKDYLLSLCINLLKENPGRMFQTREIIKLIKKDNFFTSLEKEEKERLTKDFLNAFLKEHKDSLPVEIQDLGKSKWSFNPNFVSGIDSKKTLSEIVEEILVKNGEPLSAFQLSERVKEIRGFKNFQMHTTLSQRRILYISPNVYGLRDRDIDLSNQKEEQFISEILNSLNASEDKIIGSLEVQKIIHKQGLGDSVNLFLAPRLMQRHIPVGQRRTPAKLKFLVKIIGEEGFLVYLPEVSDKFVKRKIDDFIKQWDESSLSIKLNRGGRGRRGIEHWDYRGFCKFIKEETLQNRSQYMKWRKKNLPEKAFLPQHPENTYKEYWNGWDAALKNNF